MDVHEQPRSRAFKILYVAHDRRIPPFEFRWLREPVVVAGDWDQVLFGAPERYCDMLLLDFSGCDGPFVERVLRRAAGHSYRVLGLIPPEAMDEALGVLGSSPHENLNIFCVTPQVRSHLSSLVEHGLLLSVKRSISQATSERRYQQLTDERSEIKRLQHLANKDPLTGASNRRALESDFARWQFAGTRPEDIGLILVDLDHLKQINDVLGHEAGDRALRGVVTGMRRNVRRADLIYRIGGDEFVLLMPHMSKTEFRRLLLRMMTWLETIPMGGGDRLGVIPRLSFGSAHGSELDATTLDELLRLADRRLYERRACVRRASGAASSPTPFSWSRSA